jgi:PAS domain S-box-containing protein
VVLTIAIFIISVISLLSGWQTIFQNLFYFPIILACVYYVKRGFVFSVLLACGYFVLMGCFSQDFVMLEGAFVRVLIFILVSGVITYLSMIRIRAEDTLYESKRQLDAMAANIPGVVYRYYVNPDGTTGFDYISGRSRQILGLENDNFTFFDRFTEGIVPEERKRFLSSVQHAISTKTLWEFDSQYAKPSGEKIWISAISSPVMEKDQLIFDGVIFDNTDRKEADEFIRLLAHISDDAPASITVHDNEGNFLYANEETLRLHGYTREEFLAKNLHEIDVPESEQLIAERMQKIRDAGSAEFDVQHFRKDGSILPLHLNAKPVDWRGRKVLLSIATDISDRKIAEEILKESEDRFRAISEYSHNAICIIDKHAKILWVNDKMLALGGYSREQVYAVESFVGFIAPESIEFVVSNFSKVLAGEPYEHHYNFYIIRADGEKRLCEKYMMDVVDTHGKRNLIISMLDITERKRADEALRGSDARQRAMIANITDVIAIIDTQGIIRYKSENIEKIFGWKPEELVGLSFRETAHPEDVEQITHVFLKLIEDENASTTIEYRYKLKDGSFHTIHLTAKNLIHDPNINGVLVNYHDITEHKLAKDTLLNVNQKLNVLSQLTRKDLANQIFVLNSYLELAKHQLAGQDLIIETVQKGVRAIQSIHETIEYSKDYQDMGAKPPKWQNVKMALLFGLSHISIGNIQHSLETENLEIFADPLLEKVCQRLFENSVKHGDHVTLIRVWHTTTPAGVTIFFEDNGIGISEEKKEQIFLRDESTGRASMRSLIFVREILDITGITIRETGEPGKGARFEMMVQKGAWRMRKEDGV